jgi:hypothetical protein
MDVVLHISTYPGDFPFLKQFLIHKIKFWGRYIQRIVVSIDAKPAQSGRYAVDSLGKEAGFGKYEQKLLSDMYPSISFRLVDYSTKKSIAVSRRFFGVDDMPMKAWDNGPIYIYLEPILDVDERFYLHCDADMLFGGSATCWIEEAIRLFEANPNIAFISPLPGPPHPSNLIFKHEFLSDIPANVRPFGTDSHAFQFDTMSTRVFMMDRGRVLDRLMPLKICQPSSKQRLQAKIFGHDPRARALEEMVSLAMHAEGMFRVDFLGSGQGAWTLHPAFRGDAFTTNVDRLIEAVETGSMVEAQFGHYDVVPELIPHPKNSRLARMLRRGHAVRRRLFGG